MIKKEIDNFVSTNQLRFYNRIVFQRNISVINILFFYSAFHKIMGNRIKNVLNT